MGEGPRMPPQLLLLLLDMTAPRVGLRLCSIGNMPVEIVVARRRRWWGISSQLPKMEVVTVVSFNIWLWFLRCLYATVSPQLLQHTVMLPLEVVGPGGSLSVLLFITSYWGDANRSMQWWRLHTVATRVMAALLVLLAAEMPVALRSMYDSGLKFCVIITLTQPFPYRGLFKKKCKHCV